MLKKILIIAPFFALAFSAEAAEMYQELQGIWRAEVVEIVSGEKEIVAGTDISQKVQIIKAEILEGEKASEVVEVRNDYVLLKKGDKFFLNYLKDINGDVIYSAGDPDRRSVLVLFIAIFVIAVIFLGRIQGVRALLALAVSFLILLFGMLPQFLKGYSPLYLSLIFAPLILGFAMAITHGINQKTIAGFLGAITSISATVIFAEIAIKAARLSGFVTEEAVYLNISTSGSIDLSGLLLAGIIIGTLGVLDDVSLTQAALVAELHELNLEKKEIFRRAMKVGQDHLGALVNTLALAYTGASLPLLLLFSLSKESWYFLINKEIFVAEIIRTIAGTMGLALAVPVTTIISIFIFTKWSKKYK